MTAGCWWQRPGRRSLFRCRLNEVELGGEIVSGATVYAVVWYAAVPTVSQQPRPGEQLSTRPGLVATQTQHSGQTTVNWRDFLFYRRKHKHTVTYNLIELVAIPIDKIGILYDSLDFTWSKTTLVMTWKTISSTQERR